MDSTFPKVCRFQCIVNREVSATEALVACAKNVKSLLYLCNHRNYLFQATHHTGKDALLHTIDNF